MVCKKIVLLFVAVAICSLSQAQRLVSVGEGWGKTAVNTAVFRNNSVVTHNNTQFITYYDADQYMVIGKRELGSEKWQLQRTPYKGNCMDAHNVISMMVDGQGYVHIAWDHHGHPLHYVRSAAPLSLELTEPMPMTGVGEDHVTYPEFYRLADGGLLFVYRTGGSGNGCIVLKRYDLTSQRWSDVHENLVDGQGQRNAYWQMCVDSKGVIHLSWVWRETPDVATNHDLCYARSDDGGVTWRRSDGVQYTVPINAAQAEIACAIPQNSELINQTSMTTDNEGHPYIATYWREASSGVPQYFVVYSDGEKWHKKQVGERKTPFSLSGGGTKRIPISRPRLVSRTVGAKTEAYYIFRDEERGAKVSIAYTDDLMRGSWQIVDATDFSVEAWEPSYDTELWKKRHKLHIYVQRTAQGDGERAIEIAPQPVAVLEVDRKMFRQRDK